MNRFQMNRKEKKILTGMLAGTLLAGLLAGSVSVLADTDPTKYDPDAKGTITVNYENADWREDFIASGAEYELYRIASAPKMSGYEAFRFQLTADYLDLAADAGADTEGFLPSDYTDEDWQKLVNLAAEKVLTNTETCTPIGDTTADLETGLYLVLVRDTDRTNDGDALKYSEVIENEDGTRQAVTYTYSKQYAYTVAPMLLSLPASNGEGGTEFEYDAEGSLKLTREGRPASLKITKSLKSFETKDPVTFVFDIKAERTVTEEGADSTELVYSNVVSMDFTAGGYQELLFEDMFEAGDVVTVKEVYSGAEYTLTAVNDSDGNGDGVVTLAADEIMQVSFENDYNDTHKGGGAVTNHFEHDGNDWQLTQIYNEDTQ